jgi:hypothetical protein
MSSIYTVRPLRPPQAGVLPPLLAMLRHDMLQAQQIAARSLCCLTYLTGSDVAVAVKDAGGLPLIQALLASQDYVLKEHGKQVAVNLAAYGAASHSGVRHAIVKMRGLLDVLLELLGRCREENQQEAALGLKHLASEEAIRPVVASAGAGRALRQVVDSCKTSAAARQAAMQALEVVGEVEVAAEVRSGKAGSAPRLASPRSGSSTCSVCWDGEADVAWVPCGHLCMCVRCMPLVKACPICRCEGRALKLFQA